MADHDGKHRCLVEKNVPKALILPSRWQDDAESLGMETTSCLCLGNAFDSPPTTLSLPNLNGNISNILCPSTSHMKEVTSRLVADH